MHEHDADAEEHRLEDLLRRVDAVLGGSASPATGHGSAAPRASAEDELTAGRRVGPYRLERRLGAGAMGVVWLARDERLDRPVAVKLLPSHLTLDAEAAWRFGQEATAAARLAHAAIVTVHAAGETSGVRWIAMEFVDGVSMTQLLRALAGTRAADVTPAAVGSAIRSACGAAAPEPRLDERSWAHAAASWIADAAEGLAHAHGHGVLHRDVKPSNLLVDRSGRVRIVDFGLARVEDGAHLTQTGALLGTVAYMAPEALSGQRDRIDGRSDVYALGVVLHELLTLTPPFSGPSLADLVASIQRDPAPRVRARNATVPSDLELVAAKCLEKDRRQRYASAADLADDLRRFLDGRPVAARRPGPLRAAWTWARGRPWQAALMVVAALLAVALPVAGSFVERAAARAQARAALDDSRAMSREHDELVTGLAAARRRLFELESADGPSSRRPPGRSAEIAAAERRIRELEIRRATVLEAELAAIHRAQVADARTGGTTPETDRRFAEHFMLRHRIARDGQDADLAGWWAARVREHDGAGRFAGELAGRAALRLRVDPPTAEVFLFRYDESTSFRADAVPRLVPVPVPVRGDASVDAGRWPVGDLPGDVFAAGDPCLVVTAVETDSWAAREGVRPGDLIVRIGSDVAARALYVGEVVGGGAADLAGVAAWERIEAVEDTAVTGAFEWDEAVPTASRSVTIAGRVVQSSAAGPLDAAIGVRAVEPHDLVARPAPEGGADVTLLQRGRVRRVTIPGAERAGWCVEPTACPLVAGDENRVPAETTLALAPGSYLLAASATGRDAARLPVRLPHGGDVAATLVLPAGGATPPGCVWIGAGEFLEGGEDHGFRDFERTRRPRAAATGGFFLARFELSAAEWLEFLNDAALRRGDVGADVQASCVPRGISGEPLLRPGPDGTYSIPGADRRPIWGLSGDAVRKFLSWRNERAIRRGERWFLRLPTHTEWERAARGADGRRYPWGDRLDSALCVNMELKRRYLPDAPSGFEPCDESPFGVRDMAGSLREWVEGGVCGGAWDLAGVDPFRCARWEPLAEDHVVKNLGLRLVFVPRDAEPERAAPR